jgi:hypothetical protein
VALGHAYVHALGAALAVHRVDEEAEVGASMPFLAGTSPYFAVWTKCALAVFSASAGSFWVAANAVIAWPANPSAEPSP